MTDAQFNKLIEIGERLLLQQQHWTLTQATDWPMLAAVGGVIFALLLIIWRDLKNGQQTMEERINGRIRGHEMKAEREIDDIESEIKEIRQELFKRKRDREAGRVGERL